MGFCSKYQYLAFSFFWLRTNFKFFSFMSVLASKCYGVTDCSIICFKIDWLLNVPLMLLFLQAFTEFENDMAELEGIMGEYHDPIYAGGSHEEL